MPLLLALSVAARAWGQAETVRGLIVYTDEFCGWSALRTPQGYTLAQTYGATVVTGDTLEWHGRAEGLLDATIIERDADLALWIEALGLSAEHAIQMLRAKGCPESDMILDAPESGPGQ